MKWNQPTHQPKEPTAPRQAKPNTNQSFFMKMIDGFGAERVGFVDFGLVLCFIEWVMGRAPPIAPLKERQAKTNNPTTQPLYLLIN